MLFRKGGKPIFLFDNDLTDDFLQCGSGNRKMYFIRRVENVWLSS